MPSSFINKYYNTFSAKHDSSYVDRSNSPNFHESFGYFILNNLKVKDKSGEINILKLYMVEVDLKSADTILLAIEEYD